MVQASIIAPCLDRCRSTLTSSVPWILSEEDAATKLGAQEVPWGIMPMKYKGDRQHRAGTASDLDADLTKFCPPTLLGSSVQRLLIRGVPHCPEVPLCAQPLARAALKE